MMTWGGALLGAMLVLFLGVPVALLIVAAHGGIPAQWAQDIELRAALLRTAGTATVATVIGMMCGSPLAYLLARKRFLGRSLLAAIIDVPLLIPHPVAGIAILLTVGRESGIGRLLLDLGVRVVGTPTGIIVAMLFVAVPLYVSAAREAFAKVDTSYEIVARTLGAAPWRVAYRITLPLAARGLLSAAVVMWSRAVSEFGAVVVLTYNPKVVSILSYDRLTSAGLHEALPVAAIVIVLSLIPLTALRALRYERDIETAL
jgi:molybdate/tungstate transport system permease protein